MEPVYRNIEFCRNAETLWGKLREGRWDWLGVHPERQFVLGAPAREGVIGGHLALTSRHKQAPEGTHGVRIYDDPRYDEAPSQFWFPTAEQARAEFNRRVAEYEAANRPLLMKLELVLDGRLAEREFVVKSPSTYDWRPAP
jgi:hypothetical protein